VTSSRVPGRYYQPWDRVYSEAAEVSFRPRRASRCRRDFPAPRDSASLSVCNFLARTRASTCSSSAQSETLPVSPPMLVVERKRGAGDTTGCLAAGSQREQKRDDQAPEPSRVLSFRGCSTVTGLARDFCIDLGVSSDRASTRARFWQCGLP
jgi:hypothetical protein